MSFICPDDKGWRIFLAVIDSGDDEVIRYIFLTECFGCSDKGVTVPPGSGRVMGMILFGCENSLVCS